MSLSVDGVWKAGVWATTVWASGVWREGTFNEATLSGTAVPAITKQEIIAGGNTIIITLSGVTWAAAGTGPIGSTADTQAIIDGITAATSPTNGWNNVVRAGIDIADVVRTSDTICTITLDPEATYNVTASETITVTVPAVAHSGSNPLVATPTLKAVIVDIQHKDETVRHNDTTLRHKDTTLTFNEIDLDHNS